MQRTGGVDVGFRRWPMLKRWHIGIPDDDDDDNEDTSDDRDDDLDDWDEDKHADSDDLDDWSIRSGRLRIKTKRSVEAASVGIGKSVGNGKGRWKLFEVGEGGEVDFIWTTD